MLKFAFLVFIISCGMHRTFVASAPADSDSIKKDVEIVGRATVDILKAGGELIHKSLDIIKGHVSYHFSRTVEAIVLKVHVIVTGIDPKIFYSKKLELSYEETKEFYVTAKTILELRERLDKMEKVEYILDNVIQEAAKVIDINTPGYRLMFVNSLRNLYDSLDKNFRNEPTLGDIYKIIKEKNGAAKFKIDEDEEYKFTKVEDLPEEAKQKLARSYLNKLFLHHAANRITNLRKEYFVLARSTIELAKDPKKFDKVQRIYEETLSEVTPTVDIKQLNLFATGENFFGKLQQNFKQYPSLESELQSLQKDVSRRNDWDASLWDLDVFTV